MVGLLRRCSECPDSLWTTDGVKVIKANSDQASPSVVWPVAKLGFSEVVVEMLQV